MIPSRRKDVSDLKHEEASHAGLWLDRYLREQPERKEKIDAKKGSPLTNHMKEVAAIPPPDLYPAFYERWKAALHSCGAVCRTAEVRGRLVVGLGDESVLETSVALHHTYGVPCIPGSALKGLAASFVRQKLDLSEGWGEWDKDKNEWKPGPAYITMFGNTDDAGFFTFFDALYVPESGYQGQVLYPDVMTVHHREYYGNGDVPPADWDSPNPVPFLSATGRYLVALAGPEAWVQTAFEILAMALDKVGVGAKTSSGYGRMEMEGGGSNQELQVAAEPGQEIVDDLVRRVRGLPMNRVATEIHALYQEWQKLAGSPAQKRQVAQEIVTKVYKAGRERNSADKSWYKELLASLEEE